MANIVWAGVDEGDIATANDPTIGARSREGAGIIGAHEANIVRDLDALARFAVWREEIRFSHVNRPFLVVPSPARLSSCLLG